jgi:hypothetical protein
MDDTKGRCAAAGFFVCLLPVGKAGLVRVGVAGSTSEQLRVISIDKAV